MATFGYVLLSSNRDSGCQQVRDIGKADRWFLEKSSYRSVNVFKRPMFQDAFIDIRRGDTFVVCAVDLLSGNPRELLRALLSLKKKGVTVVVARSPFTLTSTYGKEFMATLRALVKMQIGLQSFRW